MFLSAFINALRLELRAASRTTFGRLAKYVATRAFGEMVDEANQAASLSGGDIQTAMRNVCLEVFPPVMIELRAKNNIERMCIDLADRLLEETTPDIEEVMEDADEGGYLITPEEAAREACENIVYDLDTFAVCKNFWNNKSLL